MIFKLRLSTVLSTFAGASLLAACGGTTAPASSAAPAASTAAKPATSAAAEAKPAASATSPKPAASGAAEAKPAASGAAEKPATAAPTKLDAVKLADGVYGVQAVNAGMNTGFVVGDDAVLTFACNPSDY